MSSKKGKNGKKVRFSKHGGAIDDAGAGNFVDKVLGGDARFKRAKGELKLTAKWEQALEDEESKGEE